MALVVLKVFSNLQEAQIAAGALSAAGLHPTIPDAQVGSTYWILQQGIGGLRLCVPEAELQAAAAVLHEATTPAADEDRRRPAYEPASLWPLRTAGAVGLALLGATPGGWLFARSKGARGALGVGFGCLVLLLLLVGLFVISRPAGGL